MPFAAMDQYGDLLFSPLSSQPQLGIPLPYPGFTGTVQQALRPYPQYTSVSYLNAFRGKTRYNSLQTTRRASLQAGLRACSTAYTWSKTEDTVLQQDGTGDEWALASGRHFPHFLKLTWIYELPIGPGKAVNVDGVLGQIVGGWTLTGIHNYRSGSTLVGLRQPYERRRLSDSSRHRGGGGSGHLRRLGRSTWSRGTPYLNPAAFAHAAVHRTGDSRAHRHGTGNSARRARPRVLLGGLRAAQAVLGRRGSNVEFRADFINVLNRSGLAGPNTDLCEPGLRPDLRRGLGTAAHSVVAPRDVLSCGSWGSGAISRCSRMEIAPDPNGLPALE